MKEELSKSIQCTGCECECQVEMLIKPDGEIICLGGNNCPTGEIFARAQCEKS